MFKVIPMLNPDGVVVGNSRTSLAGVDLNRVYKKPRKDLFPTVYYTKAMLASFKQEREVSECQCIWIQTIIDQFMNAVQVVLYLDLHGHSRKQNVFTYGCHSHNSNHKQILNERLFPFLLSRQVYMLKIHWLPTLELDFDSTHSFLACFASRAASFPCNVAKSQQVEW